MRLTEIVQGDPFLPLDIYHLSGLNVELPHILALHLLYIQFVFQLLEGSVPSPVPVLFIPLEFFNPAPPLDFLSLLIQINFFHNVDGHLYNFPLGVFL